MRLNPSFLLEPDRVSTITSPSLFPNFSNNHQSYIKAIARVPFDKSRQLYHDLEIQLPGKIRRKPSDKNPGHPTKTHLPGCPQLQLDSQDIEVYFRQEIATEELDAFEPRLWLVAKQDSAHISSLTEQIVRGRNVVITEKPRLHLVWAFDRVFIKPLPKYLLSWAFWQHYLVSQSSPIQEPVRSEIRRAALGFLRSYAYLVQHKSDMKIAHEKGLIPDAISFSSFACFTAAFEIHDDEVSPRFRYGELRLTRLNIWFKVFFIKLNYSKLEWQYSSYIARYYAPMLFVFAVASLLLASMQVLLAVQALDKEAFTKTALSYRQFSLFTVYFITSIIAFLVLLILGLLSREMIFALNDRS